jgi:putative membrane protein
MTRIRIASALIAVCLVAGWSSPLQAQEVSTTVDQVSKAMDCALYEKDLAAGAIKKATNDDVKRFAQQVYDDHDRMSKDLLDIAKDLKLAVASGLTKDQKVKVAELIKLSGKDYDKRFIDIMVEEHEKALKMAESCAKETKEARLRTFSEKAVPTLRKHLDEAKALQKKLSS